MTAELPQVSSRYRLIEPAGQGAQCIVYRAVDQSSGRTVAVRLARADLPQADAERALRHELSAGKHDGWRSPAVAQMLDHGTSDAGTAFIVTEWVDGKTLSGYLAERGPMSPSSLILLFTPLANALDKAHRAGLRHGDLKPSNLMIAAGDAPRAVLIDFGLAQDANVEATLTGAVRGTPRYLAPELIQSGAPVDYRADLYAFAAILYESLTGRAPFTQTDTPALLYAHAHTPPPAPSEVNPALPTRLDDVFARALAKAPSARYASASSLLDAVYAAIAPRTTRVPWARIAGPALAGLAVVAGVMWLLARQAASVAAPASIPTPNPIAVVLASPTDAAKPTDPSAAQVLFKPDTTSGGAMQLVNGALYVPDSTGRIHKINPGDGGSAWPAIALDPLLTGPPLLIGDLIIAANERGQAQAWVDGNAVPRWSRQVDYTNQSLQLNDRILLIKFENVLTLDPKDGVITGIFTRTTDDGWGTPFGRASDGASALVATWSGLFQRATLKDDGVQLLTAVKDVPDVGNLTGPPIDDGGSIAASYKRGALRVWNEDGTFRWDTSINEAIATQPAFIRVSDKQVALVVGAEDGTLRAFDAGDGKPLWTYRFGAAVQAQPSEWRGEGVIVGATNGEVALIDLGSGEAKRTWQVAGSVRVPVVVDADNSRAFVRANEVWVVRR